MNTRTHEGTGGLLELLSQLKKCSVWLSLAQVDSIYYIQSVFTIFKFVLNLSLLIMCNSIWLAKLYEIFVLVLIKLNKFNRWSLDHSILGWHYFSVFYSSNFSSQVWRSVFRSNSLSQYLLENCHAHILISIQLNFCFKTLNLNQTSLWASDVDLLFTDIIIACSSDIYLIIWC